MSAAQRISSVKRLQQLPSVFSLNQAVRRLGMDRHVLSVYLARLERAEWVRKAGPRSGIYYNLLRDPQAHQKHLVEAIRLAYPSAVLYGASVLHSAGWTTQIPRAIHIAVMSRPSYPKIDGVEFYRRPRSWFLRHGEDILKHPDFASYGLPALSPGVCLTDMRRYRDGWVPDPDDIEDPSVYEDLVDDEWHSAGAEEPGYHP